MISHIAKTLQDAIIWVAWLPWVIFIGKAAIVWLFACAPVALFTMIMSKPDNAFRNGGLVLYSGMPLPIIGMLAILIHWLLGLLV